MSIDPFIEAEEATGHSVSNACCLLEVFRPAYYERQGAVHSAWAVIGAELTEQITAITPSPREPMGPRGCTGPCANEVSTVASADPAFSEGPVGARCDGWSGDRTTPNAGSLGELSGEPRLRACGFEV